MMPRRVEMEKGRDLRLGIGPYQMSVGGAVRKATELPVASMHPIAANAHSKVDQLGIL